MKRVFKIGLYLFLASALASPLWAESETPHEQLSKESAQLLLGAVGRSNVAVVQQLAMSVSPEDLVAGFYHSNRAIRRIALDVSGYLADPWPVLPYLAAFMGARDRQVASHAADSLFRVLQNIPHGAPLPPDVVPGQVVQLQDQLISVSKIKSIEIDLKIAALYGAGILGAALNAPYVPDDIFFKSKNWQIRAAALGLLSVPFDEQILSTVAVIATSDEDVLLRGTAVGLLCENALSHNVKRPSSDLEELINNILSVVGTPEAIAPVLGCLIRMPYDGRAQITDQIVSHPDKTVRAYWEELSKR